MVEYIEATDYTVISDKGRYVIQAIDTLEGDSLFSGNREVQLRAPQGQKQISVAKKRAEQLPFLVLRFQPA